MRKLFGWRPSAGKHRLGNPAFPNLVPYTAAPVPDRTERKTFVHPRAPRVEAWTPGPRGILAS